MFDFIRVTAAIPGLIWMRPKLIYQNEAARKWRRGGALMVSNHIGLLDPVCLMIGIWYRRHHFICLKEFFNGRVSGWFFRQFHCIPIDRENFSMDTLRLITEELKEGHLVTMFPEGHLNTDGSMSPFKSGMILLSMQSGRPIIPVYMKKREHWYSRLVIAVGEPINVSGELGARPSLSEINRMTKQLEDTESKLSDLIAQT